MRYIYIPYIDIVNSNALSSTATASELNLTAIWGFVHNLGLKLEIPLDKFSVVYHNSNLHVTTNEKGSLHRNIKSTTFNDVSLSTTTKLPNKQPIQPDLTCDLLISLFIEIEDEDSYILENELYKVNSLLRNKVNRIGGGTITDYASIEIIDSLSPYIKYGRLVKDSSALVSSCMNEHNINPIKAMYKVITSETERFFNISNIGYNIISSIRNGINGAVNGLDHCYCEPVQGLIEYVSTKDPKTLDFFSMTYYTEHNGWLITADQIEI